jgi:SAM-dependent methyltransferase
VDRFNIYDDEFSKVYDRFWKDFILEIGPQIKTIDHKYLETSIGNRKILDLFCGTGRLAKILCSEGYHVTGIDKSNSMLNLAKIKLNHEINNNQAKFIQGLAENFELDERFEIVVSTFDSINHLENLNQIKLCFSRVYQHLETKGIFLFDMNTEEVLKNWNFIDLDESDDKSIIYIMHGQYNVDETKAYTRVTGFIDENKDGFYKRFDEIMYNSVFKISDILTILSDIGFHQLVLYDEHLQHTIPLEIIPKDRVFILAIKSE